MEIHVNAQANKVKAPSTTSLHKAEVLVGAHSVKLGNNPPVRLDKIGHAYIRPLGVRSSVRLKNTAAGMDRQSNLMLDALKRDHGSLDAQSLVKAMNTFDRYAYYQLKTKKVQNPAMVNVKGMAHTVAQLSNSELTKVYTTLLSQDLADLKMAMQHEARTNPKLRNSMLSDIIILKDLESLVTCEVSRRTIMATMPPEDIDGMKTLEEEYGYGKTDEQVTHRGDDDLRAPGMFNVVSRAIQSDKAAKAADSQYVKSAEAHQLTPMDVRKLGDAMRNAELTINISPNILFGDGKDPDAFPVNDPNFGIKNMFQLKEEDIKVSSKSYELIRETAEDALFPSLRGHITGKERPVYGALNTVESLTGACSTYGNAVLILKPEVKQTATYTYGDTIKIPYIKLDAAKKADFVNALLNFEDILAPTTREALQDPGSELSRAIDDLLATGKECTIEDLTFTPTFKKMMNLMEFMPDHDTTPTDKGYFVQHGLLKAFQDPEKNFRQVASFDHLESLLPVMGEGNVLQLDQCVRAKNPMVKIQGVDYIEAQLATPMNLRRDVAEIRMNISNFESDERANILKWGEEAGVKITFFNDNQNARKGFSIQNQTMKIMTQVKELHKGLGIKDAFKAFEGFNIADRVQARFDAHPRKARIQELLNNKPILRGELGKGIEGMLRNELMFGVMNSSMGYVSDEDTIRRADDKLNSIIDAKFSMLLKLDELHFDNETQKLAFANWVTESRELKSVSEMLLYYNGMIQNAGELLDFLNKPDAATPERFNEIVATYNMNNINNFLNYMGGSNRGDYGGDDIYLAFKRFASLTMGYIKDLPNGMDKIQELAHWVGTQEYKAFEMTCAAVTEKIGTIRTDEEKNTLRPALMMASYLVRLAETVSEKLELPHFSAMDPMDLEHIPQSLRDKTIGYMPAISTFVNEHWPVNNPARTFETFSLPATDSIPQNSLKDRRDFLRGQLEAYHKHDLTFDINTDTHGRSHAVRAFIFANVLCNILKKRGIEVDINAVSFAIAGHDSGRQGPGPDRWEADSAKLCQDAVAKATHNPGDAYLKDIADCIQSNQRDAPTLEALLLHCADSMDFTRIAEIDMTAFPFLREDIIQGTKVVQADDKLRHALATEARRLTCLTHPATGAREETAKLMQQVALDSSNMEAMQKYQNLQKDIAAQTADRAQNETNDQVLERIEGIIKDNPTLFPLLNEFYTD